MNEITRVGIDLAKRVIQVHAVNASGQRVTAPALPRQKFLAWCAPARAAGASVFTFTHIAARENPKRTWRFFAYIACMQAL